MSHDSYRLTSSEDLLRVVVDLNRASRHLVGRSREIPDSTKRASQFSLNPLRRLSVVGSLDLDDDVCSQRPKEEQESKRVKGKKRRSVSPAASSVRFWSLPQVFLA